MLLFLPEGVLSITAHSKNTFDLKVRALNREMITRYFDAAVYYDSTEDLPYHTTVMRPQLQELMFIMLERMRYTYLPETGNGTHYGTLLKQVHRSMNIYPDYQIATKPVPKEPEFVVPEASNIFVVMVLQNFVGKSAKHLYKVASTIWKA